MRFLIALTLVTSACGFGTARAEPTVAPLISAAFLTVHLVAGPASDAQERSRLPELRDAVAGALPPAWAVATGGRGQLFIRTDADIDVELDGSPGTSALTEHKRDGRLLSRTIAIHTIDGGRHLSISELMATTLHELGHIWCCYGSGTKDGHWTEAPAEFTSVGLMTSAMRCEVSPGGDPVCPSIFSDRELAEMHLIAAP